MKNERKFTKKAGVLLLAAVLALSLGLTGCGSDKSDSKASSSKDSSSGKTKVTIAYSGGTCEAPLYVAYHKGYFKKEGLDVTMVEAGFDELKQGLASGKIDAAEGNFAWLKSIEQGLGLKLTAGVHTGCIRAVVPANSTVKTVADLKGKTIGVDSIGGGPQIALSVKLREAGLGPQKDVSWKAYEGNLLDTALQKGEIQAYMTWDPFPPQAVADGKARYLLDIGQDKPFKDKYCCFIGIRSSLIKEDKETAAKITRAILAASDYVNEHPEEAAKIAVDNKYIGSSVELNTKLIKEYNWAPSIKQAKESVKFYIKELKAQGILDKDSSESQLYKDTFAEVISDYNGK